MPARPRAPRARFTLATLHVRRFAECRAFYKDVIGLPERRALPRAKWAEFGPARGVAIAIHERQEGEGGRRVGGPSGLFLDVADAEKAHAAYVARGAQTSYPPARAPWGGVVFGLLDPDGNEINFTGP
ncbi:MAG TPA: VOC family protein [Candidatus Thermoplasmatota archaeon]|nr:VOC family protein [Candidatus Thermoplasmatota archaeon]